MLAERGEKEAEGSSTHMVRAAQDAPACFEFEVFPPNQDGSERAGDSCRDAKAWRFLKHLVNDRYFSVRHRLVINS